MKNYTNIREFRKDLRRFERSLTYQVNCTQCHGVTLAQCHTLLELDELGISNIGDLAKSMNLDKSTVSRTIDSLVKKEYVHRIIDPNDRRYAKISLTDSGQKKCNEINKKNDDYFEQVFQKIPIEKQSSIKELFQLFIDAIQKVSI